MDKQQHQFIDILQKAKPAEYLSSDPEININQTQPPEFFPSQAEVVAHLKLLKAFEVMKNKLVPVYDEDDEHDQYREKSWQCLLTLAVRRFIIFMSAAKKAGADDYKLGLDEEGTFRNGNVKNGSFINLMDGVMPPLDVIQVWHAFLLNPKSFYDTCMRNKMLQFANFPFPLLKISQYIDNHTFEFKVPPKLQENYLDLLSRFDHKTDHSFEYEKIHSTRLSLYCPGCHSVLCKSIRVTDGKNGGFADKHFQAPNIKHIPGVFLGESCYCRSVPQLSHESIRYLHLMTDIAKPTPLPGTYKYFSAVLAEPKFRGRQPLILSRSTKEILKYPSRSNSDIVGLLDSFRREFPNDTKRCIILVRNYLQYNYISMTVENGIQIGEDLVGCVLRQQRFVEKMNKLDWLHSPVLRQTIEESLLRYGRFFEMLTEDRYHRQMLVPTLDIDLIWHTHQLTFYGYVRDCKQSPGHSVVDHDDKIDENQVHNGFSLTAKRYKSMFKEDYSVCYCAYCTQRRHASRGLLKSLFKNKKENLSPSFQKDLTHISTHNSINLPTEKAIKASTLNRLPWAIELEYLDFPVSPAAPVESSHSKFYAGLCSSVNAQCSTDSGNCCYIPSCTSHGGSACISDTGLACGGSGGDGSGCGGGGD
ncbi:GRDP1 Glycine-rich domain-containing protein 1 [Candida maltosa Xu316]